MKQLTDNLNQLFADFAKDAALQVEAGNKAAGTRARKASLAIEKALKEMNEKFEKEKPNLNLDKPNTQVADKEKPKVTFSEKEVSPPQKQSASEKSKSSDSKSSETLNNSTALFFLFS